MLCLNDETVEELKTLYQEHTRLTIQCNQDKINILSINPYIKPDQVRVMNEINTKYSNLLKKNQQTTTAYIQLATEYQSLRVGSNLVLGLLLLTWAFLFIKWLIKLEAKMSKRYLKKPIHFEKWTRRK